MILSTALLGSARENAEHFSLALTTWSEMKRAGEMKFLTSRRGKNNIESISEDPIAAERTPLRGKKRWP
jgi:uncharacterized protein YjgD (DUF1641 family)